MITLTEDWNNQAVWDDFVERHEQGRFCHLFHYSDVVACYDYTPARIAFTKNRSLVAVLPAALTHSLLFGPKLVSQPFSEYGGMLVDPSLDPDDIVRIYALLKEYMNFHPKLRVLEAHGDHGIPPQFRPGPFSLQNPHHVAVLALDRTPDELWRKVVEYSVRKGVNKALQNGVEAFEECNERIIRERFFPLYLKSMKRLGVPPHSVTYYLRCFELLGERLKIFWAVRDQQFLAGLLGFVCGRRVNIVNIVSTPEAWKYAPNDLIHWEFIKWAAESGFKHFDFGSVRYEGQRTYKKKWGVAFEDHGYHMLSTGPSSAAQPVFNSSSPSMAGFSKAWSNYIPGSVAKLAGPTIRKHLVR